MKVENINPLVVRLNAKAAEVVSPEESILYQDAAIKIVELAEALRLSNVELERVTDLRNKFSERLSLLLMRLDEVEKENGRLMDQAREHEAARLAYEAY